MQTSQTRSLLYAGALAGPLYIVVGALEMIFRSGFDPLRNDLSLMSNGSLGWIHITLLIVCGLLTVAGAIGIRRKLRGRRGGTWGPVLLALYGLGLVGAGVFVADPANGFPAGTPAGLPTHVSAHGNLHFITAALGFIGLTVACFVLARGFAAKHERGWALYSRLSGIAFFAAFVGIATGSQQHGAISVTVTLAFTAAVIIGWTWLSAVSLHLARSGSR